MAQAQNKQHVGKGAPKAGVDWLEIRGQIESGLSFSEVAKHHDVTRQAISARARREGWDLQGETTGVTPIVTWLRNRQWGYINETTVRMILDLLAQGKPEKPSVIYCGITIDRWNQYKKEEPELAQQIEAAKAGGALHSFNVMYEASERGDWKAGERLLTIGDHKDDYTEQDKGQGGLTVILNIPDPKAVKTIKPVTIEHDS